MDRRHDRATAPIILRGRVLRPLNVGAGEPGTRRAPPSQRSLRAFHAPGCDERP